MQKPRKYVNKFADYDSSDDEIGRLFDSSLTLSKISGNNSTQSPSIDEYQRKSANKKSTKRDKLQLESLNFRPNCDITTREAIHAINRANSQECKHQLANVTCELQQGSFYPSRLPSFCLINCKLLIATLDFSLRTSSSLFL